MERLVQRQKQLEKQIEAEALAIQCECETAMKELEQKIKVISHFPIPG
jgi:hypothetical protein